MSLELVPLAVLMFAVTYPSRAIGLLNPAIDRMPRRVLDYLQLVGPAVLAALAAVNVIVDPNEGRPLFVVGLPWLSVFACLVIVRWRHNLALVDDYRDPGFSLDVLPVDFVPEAQRAQFMAYVRPDGGHHAQLHRPAQLGQLLGHGDPPHCRARHTRAAGGLPERGWCGCVCADQRLQHVVAQCAL